MPPEENELQKEPSVPESPVDRNARIKEYLQDPNGVLDALDANYLYPCSLDNMVSRQYGGCRPKQKNGGRTKVLETVPVHNLADIFVAGFEISFEEQLSMLDSVDLKSIQVAEMITQKVEGQLSKSQKEFLLRQLAGLGRLRSFFWLAGFRSVEKLICA